MSKKVSVLAVVAIVAAGGSVAVVQADSGAPADAAKLSPPVIHESFTPLPCPRHPVSTPEGCVEKRLLETDKKIDHLNAAIFSELSEGPYGPRLSKASLLHKFLASHRVWFAYRNADCLNMYAALEEGTISPIVVGNCEVTRNEQRIKNLQAFMRFPEG
jgi:uncharacterized protein YecT (DUF1311 family)